MLFTDPLFLFYFLPLALIVHGLSIRGCAGRRYPFAAKVTILLLTLLFYAAKEVWWLIPLFVCTAGDYLWAKLIHSTDNRALRKLWLWSSVAQNAALLSLFKYGELVHATLIAHWPHLAPWFPRVVENGFPAAFPAGISFYTFESMSFVIDVYRREIAPPRSLADYGAFLAMFPRFIAGPIVRYKTVSAQFESYSGPQVEKGLKLFVWGLFLKICFADHFAVFTAYAFQSAGPLTAPAAWTGAVAYMMQLYFDFSGYSLMAIGLGDCLGFAFPDNFRTPYLSNSLQEFWNRWHITLGAWVMQYVYFPLAVRARRSRARVFAVILVTFLAIGLWHGVSWNYVVLGALFGIGIALEAATGFPRKVPWYVARAWTLGIVLVGWTIARSRDLSEAKKILSAMFLPGSSWRMGWGAFHANPMALSFCIAGLVYCFGVEGRSWAVKPLPLYPRIQAAGLVVLFVFSVALAYSARAIPFLYFQF